MSKIGFKDDMLFLLSVEEYEKYKDKIDNLGVWWWLRSSGYDSNIVAGVTYDGTVIPNGSYVNSTYDVRPALHYESIENEIILANKPSYFFWKGNRWKIIDEENKIAISDRVLLKAQFDTKSNNYENSKIRKKLLELVNIDYF